MYDFAGSPQELGVDPDVAKQVGKEVAQALVGQIDAMGLPAVEVVGEPSLVENDLVIRGTLLAVVEGSEAERVAIGMGKGAAELKVAVEGYQMTSSGLREVGSGKLDTQASKSPGAAVPLAVTVATKNPLGLIVSTGMKLHDEETGAATIHGKAKDVAQKIAGELRPRFAAQGWIPAAAPGSTAP